MSAATEIAEREAAEAEAEFPDQPDGDQPEPETGDAPEPVDITGATILPEPEPAPAPLDEKAVEKAFKSIDTRGKTYMEAVQKLLVGVDIPLTECPCCQIPGYVLPFDQYDANELARKHTVELYFGVDTLAYKPHPTQVMCPECEGFGKMSNGAKGDATPWTLCWRCHGSGTIDTTMPPPAAPSAYSALPAPVQLPVQPWQPQPTQPPPAASEILTPPAGWHANGSQGADSWARWPGHPRYGIDPSLSGW